MTTNSPAVLIVDDEVELLDVLESLLEIEGAEVFRATNGLEAWKILETQKVDVVLSDVKMPEMSGTELLKKIRSKNPQSPAVYLCSGHSDLNREELEKMGANGFLAKPFDFSYVTKLLRNSIESFGQNFFDSKSS